MSFAPTYSAKEFDNKIDLFHFYRNLHLKVWYKQTPRALTRPLDSGQPALLDTRSQFKSKSTFCPLVQSATLKTFARKVIFDIENLFKSKRAQKHFNLSMKEKAALETLSTDEDIVIKKVDKGGAIVVWGKDMYVKEVYRQLYNRESYQPLTFILLNLFKLNLIRFLGWLKRMVGFLSLQ